VSQERLFGRSEMAVPVRVYVLARLVGFGLRQAARAERRKQQRAKLHVSDSASLLQACFGFEMTPKSAGPR